jgi:hypothetical protein
MPELSRYGAVILFGLSVVTAGVAPLLGEHRSSANPGQEVEFSWPTHYEGVALRKMPLSEKEDAFLRDFPGRVGRFLADGQEIIIRRVETPTRRLHSAAECLRGNGYSVTPLPSREDAFGHPMGCMRARLASESLEVCELIRDDHGSSWPDVSEWYWHALFDPDSAPWWSYVVARGL